MRVLLVTHHWGNNTHHSKSSGYERLAYYLNNLCDITVLTWGKKNVTVNENSIKVIYKKTPSTDFLLERRLFLSYYAYKLAKDFDLVHGLYSECSFFPCFKYSVISSVHIVKELDSNLWMKYKSLFEKIVFKKSVVLIPLSNHLKQILEEKYNAKKTIFIPHGVDIHSFRSKDIPKNLYRMKGGFNLVCITSGIYGTNEDVLYDIAKKFQNILFIVIGKQFQKRFLNNVKFYFNIDEDELVYLYNFSDVFFKPVKFLVANNSVLEAMSVGKPIITNKIQGAHDYLNKNYAYFIEDYESYESIFNDILANPEKLNSKGKKARKAVEEKFSWEIVAKKMLEVYQNEV